MTKKSVFIKKINNYKKCMRVFDCANYIFLDEILNFKLNKISKYSKSKYIFKKIVNDFRLVNDLLNKKDVINSGVVLRSLYENIMYIIATSYDKTLIINLDIMPGKFKKILEDNCDTIFTDYFEKEDFEALYKYLCKIIHPCSLKELLSYFEKTIKYKPYLISNMKYIMVTLEYLFLNFLNKKIGAESSFDLNLIDVCTYVNLININCFLNDVDKTQKFTKQYLFFDTNNKYITESKKDLEMLYNDIITNADLIEININQLLKETDNQINCSKYKDVVYDILNDKI